LLWTAAVLAPAAVFHMVARRGRQPPTSESGEPSSRAGLAGPRTPSAASGTFASGPRVSVSTRDLAGHPWRDDVALRRRDFLAGVGGTALGVPLGAVGAGKRQPPEHAPSASPTAQASPIQEPGHMSYAQAGEDVIVNFFLAHLKIADISYLDIGAYDPILINNTYFFYKQGHRGVLIEPNVAMCEKLRAVRPEDKTLEAGIGIEPKPGVADYYVMSEPSWNTFDRAEAEHQVKATGGKVTIKEVRKTPLLPLNDVMAQYFKGKAPAFLSIDAEGWHFKILKSIDFTRFRPKAICVETLVSGEYRTMPEIPAFMKAQGYVDRGGSFVNTIFVDSKLLV
jgi:hypothetical protein